MHNNNETIADIVREMREAAKSAALFNGEEGGEPLITEVEGWADRLEAAAMRERAIVDALLAVKDKPTPHPDPEHAPPLFAGPVRNCDNCDDVEDSVNACMQAIDASWHEIDTIRATIGWVLALAEGGAA